jgi:hypothetical protein
MESYLNVLKNEFSAEENSFLFEFRCNLIWNQQSFVHLVSAMYECCEKQKTNKVVEKWIAEGFWYCSSFIKDWSTHSNFPKIYSSEYYEKSYNLLNDLAFYFFTGNHPQNNKRNLIDIFIEETK